MGFKHHVVCWRQLNEGGDSGELQEDSVSSNLEHTAADGKNIPPNFIVLMPLSLAVTG
ncbi:MAG TPA: hypothetical protein VGI43_08085 [Mucilaginibacter sp.]|jgi:hypothetical protein